MGLRLKAAIDKANGFDTLAGLQEALGMSSRQICVRLECSEVDWITAVSYDRTRKDWLRALRWLLVEKWLHDEEVAANKIGLDDSETLYEGNTPEDGKIVLERWPEGFVLHYHGKIVWRSWEKRSPAPTPAALDFMHANQKSPVISGAAKDGGGGIYGLEDGRRFELSLEDCQGLPEGYPIWKLPESKPTEPTDQDLVNEMYRLTKAIRELRTQLYARDIKIEFSTEKEAADNPYIYVRYTKNLSPKD